MLTKALLSVVLVAIGVFATATDSAGAVTELRPNLKALPASEIQIEVLADGSRHLRFSTTSANDGDGALEIRGGQVTGGSQLVHQRIYNSDGSWSDYQAGSMAYHVQHAHMHFDDFAEMVLQPLDAPSASSRTGAKQTFCIIDTDRIDHKLPGAPKRPVYVDCNSNIQGMSVGWGDTYRYYLYGQSIEITGLPNGIYDLEIRIDPKNKLIEKDESDNTSSVRIQISGDSVSLVGDEGGGPGQGGGQGRGRQR